MADVWVRRARPNANNRTKANGEEEEEDNKEREREREAEKNVKHSQRTEFSIPTRQETTSGTTQMWATSAGTCDASDVAHK